jgi:hypothetical protein
LRTRDATPCPPCTAIFGVNEPLIIEFYNLVTCLSGGSKSDPLAKAI